MGLPIPGKVEGQDLSPCLLGQEDNTRGSLMMCTGAVALFGNGFEWRGIRDKQYTYAIFRRGRDEYLFDNKEDPYQMHNLKNTPEFQQKKEELKAEMHRQMAEIGDDFPSNLQYKHRWIRHRIIQKTEDD